MDVNQMYNIVLLATGKNREQGYVSSDDFNTYISLGMRSYIAYLIGDFQTYQPGRPISKINFGQNSTVRQRLAPTIKSTSLTIASDGTAQYPPDYLQYDAITTSANKKIKFIQQSQIPSVLNSLLRPIASYPIFMIKNAGFQFYPLSLGSANLSYISNPVNIKWGFTLDVNNRKVYDPTTSVQPIFDDLVVLEIIVRALSLIGVNLTLPMVTQYASDIKINGQ